MSFPEPDIALNPTLTPELHTRLLDLWFDVSQAGGSVGYTPESPRSDVEKGLGAYIERMSSGSMHLIAAERNDRIVASCVLVENLVSLQSHFMEMKRFMVHPSEQGSGLGRWLVEQVSVIARDKLGLEFLHIHVRSGEGLEVFWERCGFKTIVTIPRVVKFESGEYRDLIYMQRDL